MVVILITPLRVLVTLTYTHDPPSCFEPKPATFTRAFAVPWLAGAAARPSRPLANAPDRSESQACGNKLPTFHSAQLGVMSASE